MERSYKKRALLEIVMKIAFLAAACMSVLCVALICIFLFANGLPAMGEIGVLNFLSGTRWKPGADIYGIFPMILGSIYVTAGALLMGVPVALLTAIYLAFFCPQKLYRVLKPAVELLAGIPSVVYGFFGIVVLVPMVRALGEKWDGSGNSMLTASILLAIMILPTIIGVVEPALRAVPRSDYEGALAVKPEVILMDEPTSALDPISTSKIEDLVMDIKKDYTIVMVTHNMQQAVRVSDTTVFFLLGEIVESGATGQMFSMPKDKRTEDYITGRFG